MRDIGGHWTIKSNRTLIAIGLPNRSLKGSRRTILLHVTSFRTHVSFVTKEFIISRSNRAIISFWANQGVCCSLERAIIAWRTRNTKLNTWISKSRRIISWSTRSWGGGTFHTI